MYIDVIFTFYNIYIKTKGAFYGEVRFTKFTFYNIYIKTFSYSKPFKILSLFTFYNIYIKTRKVQAI